MTHVMIRYEELKKKFPNLDNDLITTFAKEMPEEFENVLTEYEHEQEYGCHICTIKMYEEAVKLLKKPDGEYGAKWSVEDIARKSGIDFEKEDFTKHDFAYVVNMLYSDYGKKVTDVETILDMAEIYLTDDDYPGDPSERAYKNAKKRIKYFKHKKEEK